MKPRNRFLWFIANSRRGALFALFIGSYTAVAVLFGIVYWLGGMTSAPDVCNNIYFSFMVQMSLNTGQIHSISASGKILTIAQFLLGTIWLSFIPAIIVVRLITPPKDVFLFDKYVVFYPNLQSFRFRYVNVSRLDAVDLKFDVRAKIAVDDADYNVRNVKVLLNNPYIPDARSMVPFYMRTRVVRPDEFQVPSGKTDYLLLLHPGHLRGDMVLTLRISCLYATGTFVKTVVFDYKHIVCGRFIPIQAERNGKLNWDNLHRHILTDDTEEGREFCKSICPYRDRCRISNKVL